MYQNLKNLKEICTFLRKWEDENETFLIDSISIGVEDITFRIFDNTCFDECGKESKKVYVTISDLDGILDDDSE